MVFQIPRDLCLMLFLPRTIAQANDEVEAELVSSRLVSYPGLLFRGAVEKRRAWYKLHAHALN